MYNKEQASKIRQKFWTSFGQYMKPVPRENDEAVNWLNYKTGIKDVYFRMDAGKGNAVIAIEITNADNTARTQYYEQFTALKKLLEQYTGEPWQWQPDYDKETGATISRISKTIGNVSVMNETDWPAIIAFLKPRIIALDAFWQAVKDGFE